MGSRTQRLLSIVHSRYDNAILGCNLTPESRAALAHQRVKTESELAAIEVANKASLERSRIGASSQSNSAKGKSQLAIVIGTLNLWLKYSPIGCRGGGGPAIAPETTLKIVENSPERLALRLSWFGLSTGVCVLDRRRDTTTVIRFALVLPYSRRCVPFSQIRDVTVRRVGDRSGYRMALKVGQGRDVAIGEFDKDEALQAARAIRDFLRANRTDKSTPA